MYKRDINSPVYRSGIACFGGIPDENHWYIKDFLILPTPVCQLPPRKSILRKFAEKCPEDRGEATERGFKDSGKPCS
jgi:hypothetical protein